MEDERTPRYPSGIQSSRRRDRRSPSSDLVEEARSKLKRSASSSERVVDRRLALRREADDSRRRARDEPSSGASAARLEETREALRRRMAEDLRQVRDEAEEPSWATTAPPARSPGPPTTRRAEPVPVLSDETPPRGSAAAILAGLLAVAIGVALFAGTIVATRGGGVSADVEVSTTLVDVSTTAADGGSETTVTVPASDVATMAAGIDERGYYLEPGIEDPDGRVASAIADAAAAGIDFVAVVLVDDRPEGPVAIAAELEDRIGGGTVLVLTATRAGISSSEFQGPVLDRALDAGSVGFAEGGDPGYVEAVVEVLLEEQ